MSHTFHPDLGNPERPAILIDGCPSCEEHAKRLDDLDERFIAALWRKMVAVNHESSDHLNSHAEKKAIDQLWKFALILERYTDVDPWSLFREHDQEAALDRKFGRVLELRKKLGDDGLEDEELAELKQLESEVAQAITAITQ